MKIYDGAPWAMLIARMSITATVRGAWKQSRQRLRESPRYKKPRRPQGKRGREGSDRRGKKATEFMLARAEAQRLCWH